MLFTIKFPSPSLRYTLATELFLLPTPWDNILPFDAFTLFFFELLLFEATTLSFFCS